jgi:Transposase DDE domain
LVDRECVGDPGCAGAADPPARHGRHGKPRKDGKPSASKSDNLRTAMLTRLGSEQGKADYAQRSRTIEPVFGQVKTVQGGGRFMRRGLAACQAEWKLLCVEGASGGLIDSVIAVASGACMAMSCLWCVARPSWPSSVPARSRSWTAG